MGTLYVLEFQAVLEYQDGSDHTSSFHQNFESIKPGVSAIGHRGTSGR